MSDEIKDLINDLAAEYNLLDEIVRSLDEKTWDQKTPFSSWTIRDQISHIAFFDGKGRLSAVDPDGFANRLQEAMTLYAGKDVFEETLQTGRAKSTQELLSWWRDERHSFLEALKKKNMKDRLPWYGPPMSVRSFISARLMETWAHGQDIFDALGRKRIATDRLKHIAHIGVSTRGWSFNLRQMPPPEEAIRTVLTGPSGDLWTWGPDAAKEIVRGNAEDFCLVVTQRRHVTDTKLQVTGKNARQWMLIAQAFAGPPATGPEAGRFAQS